MKARFSAFFAAHHGRRRWALGSALVVFLVLMATLTSTGLTDDDDFYAPAGISYVRWLGRAVTLSPGAWSQPEIDRAFNPNHEHPPMAKYVMGLSWWLLSDVTRILPSLDGARAGVCFLAALLAYVVASLGFMLRGRWGAILAVLSLFLLPRFFFHAHVATLDVPVASLTTVAGYLVWRSRASRSHVWLAAFAFGAALLTKLNAPFLLVAIFLHWLLRAQRQFRIENAKLQLPAIPSAVPAMLVAGPFMFLFLWPHLWFDTIKRLGAYLQFHLNHYPIYIYYFGQLYTQTIAPWHMPWVMAAGVIPSTILVLVLLGVVQALRSIALEWKMPADATIPGDASSEQESLRAFLLIQAFITVGIVSFTNVPKYGGEKLFMPFFPLAAVLAADGAALVVAGFRAWNVPERIANLIPIGVVGAHGLFALVHFSPFNLSYYSETTLGLRGAEAIGFENTYYDVADKQLARWMNDHARSGAGVHFEPNHKEYVRTWNWLARDGYLRRDIQTVEESRADYVVLTHERRWNTYGPLQMRMRSWPVAHEAIVDGVRLYTVYARPGGGAQQ